MRSPSPLTLPLMRQRAFGAALGSVGARGSVRVAGARPAADSDSGAAGFRRHSQGRVNSPAHKPRRAVRAWGLEILCVNPAEYSSSLTAVLVPEGHNADAFRKVVLERFNMSLGQGLGKVSGKIFRIGHLGYFNDLMLCGTLAGVEMGLALAGVPHRKGGVDAAMAYLAEAPAAEVARAA